MYLQEKLLIILILEDVQGCIVSNRNDGIKAFLNKKICFLNFKDLYKKNTRPFYVVLTERALNKGLPINCNNILNEFLNELLKEKFVAKFINVFNYLNQVPF